MSSLQEQPGGPKSAEFVLKIRRPKGQIERRSRPSGEFYFVYSMKVFVQMESVALSCFW